MNAFKIAMCLVAMPALAVLASACASSSDESVDSAEGATSEATVVVGSTTSFTGSVTVKEPSVSRQTYAFTVSEIAWPQNVGSMGTAHWHSDKLPDLPMTITFDREGNAMFAGGLAGKRTRFVFHRNAGNWKVQSADWGAVGAFTYNGQSADKASFISASSASGGQTPDTPGAGSATTIGSCSMRCRGDVWACRNSVPEDECNWTDPTQSFTAVPRPTGPGECEDTLVFAAGVLCP